MPTPEELRDAAATLRKIVDLAADLPENALADARLEERIEFAADILDATAIAEDSQPPDRRR